MFIPERLKQEFPQFTKELDELGACWLRTHGTPEEAERIFDDRKENYKIIHNGFEHLAKTGKRDKTFLRLMCNFEKSLNDDKDFLTYFIKEFWSIDYSDKSVDEMKNYINERFGIA